MQLPASRGVLRLKKRISNPIFNCDGINGSFQKFKEGHACNFAPSVLSSESDKTLNRNRFQIMKKTK
jgi:hypothetical protein